MFCNNCGTRLIEGGRFCMSCGTPADAPAAVQPENWSVPEEATIPTVRDPEQEIPPAQQAATSAPDWMQTLQAGAAQAAARSKQLAQDAASSNLVQSLKALVLQLLKNPGCGLKSAWQSEENAPQLCLGAFHLLSWMILPFTLTGKFDIPMLKVFGYVLMFAIAMCCTKALHGVAYYMASDRQKGLPKVLCLMCAGSLYETIFLLLTALLLALFGVSCVSLLVVFLLAIQALGITTNYQEAVLIAGSKKAGYLVPVVTVVVSVLLILVFKFAITQAVASITGNIYSLIYSLI